MGFWDVLQQTDQSRDRIGMKAQRRQKGMMIMPLEARGAEGTRAIINVSFNVSSV